MPSARVDALFAHAAQRKILSIVALAYRTNAAVSSTRIARSSSSLPRYAARALQMRGRCSAGKRSDTHAAATSLGAMRPVEALYQMRARARTTFRSSPFQSDSAFHWAIVSKSALEKCSFGTGSKNVAADGPRSARLCCLAWHCCKVSDEAAFCLIQRPYISKTLLTRRISPRGSP